MKRIILFGSLIVVFMLMTLPSASAVEYSSTVEFNKAQFLKRIKNIDIDELKRKINEESFGGDIPPWWWIRLQIAMFIMRICVKIGTGFYLVLVLFAGMYNSIIHIL